MENDYLIYYGEKEISPVHQDISDIELHYERRRKLYRQLGIPLLAFRHASILEVGPGSGYNTLALFNMSTGGGHVDLVEANPQGICDMEALFPKYGIDPCRYSMHPCKIEEFCSDQQFDIVIAEGFLQNLSNQEDIIEKLLSLTKPGGIVVVTCTDDVSMFVEAIKRLIGCILTKDVESFEEKTEILVKAFAPQLQTLRGVSRSARDWVQDQLMNPAGINGCEMSLLDAMDMFGDRVHVLGSSPGMFKDYSWYKDVWFDVKEDFRQQFRRKRLSLLLAGMPEVVLDTGLVDDLAGCFKRIKGMAASYENEPEEGLLDEIRAILKQIETDVNDIDDAFATVFHEIQCLLEDAIVGTVDMGKYPHFSSAFGRTQQYIAFEKY